MSSYLLNYIVPALIQCIVPAIAIIYTIIENHKLNKFNRVIPLINSDFDRYVNDLSSIYIEFNSFYIKNKDAFGINALIDKIKDYRVIIHQKIKMILISLEKIEKNAKKSYNIYYKNLKTIEDYFERINSCKDTFYNDIFLEYLKYILDYFYTIPSSIYSEINKQDIREENINSIYKEIEKIQKELNKKLGETK